MITKWFRHSDTLRELLPQDLVLAFEVVELPRHLPFGEACQQIEQWGVIDAPVLELEHDNLGQPSA